MDLPHVSAALGVIHPICIARGRNAEVWDEATSVISILSVALVC